VAGAKTPLGELELITNQQVAVPDLEGLMRRVGTHRPQATDIGRAMATSILFTPVDPAVAFSPPAVADLVRSLWPSAREFRLGGDPFEIRIEVSDRSLNVRVGTGQVSLSPGSTLDDCALVAQQIVRTLGGDRRFYYMDDGNNHALVIDRNTSLASLARLPDAGPLGV